MLSEKRIKQIKRLSHLEKVSGEPEFSRCRALICELSAIQTSGYVGEDSSGHPGEDSTEAEACKIRKTDDIVIAGAIGLKGTSLIAESVENKLTGWFPPHFMKSAKSLAEECSARSGIDALVKECHAMIEIGEGGIFRALSELWDLCGFGFEIEYDKVKVHQETIEICEYYDIDPWSLLSHGAYIIVTDNAYRTVRDLTDVGIMACVAGKMRSDKDKVILHREDRSLLNRPVEDGVISFIKKEYLTGNKEQLTDATEE